MALIVTIVVLLILAGITVANITGGDSSIDKAQQAADENKISSYKEEIEVAYAIASQKNYSENEILNLVKNKLEQDGKYSVNVYNNSATIISSAENYVFEIYNQNTKYCGIHKSTTSNEPIIRTYLANQFDTETKNKITSIKTLNYMIYDDDIIQEWDVSKNKDKSVIAYIKDDGNEGYDLYISANGKIKMQADGKAFFDHFSKVTQMDLRNLDTSALTTMESMFYENNYLEELDLSSFDTSNVTKMNKMFVSNKRLEKIDLSNLNTSKVENMYQMFYGCTALTTLDLSNFNTSNVTNMTEMFRNCSALEVLDISSFTVSENLTTVFGMFGFCGELKTIYTNNSFIFNEDISTGNMFLACYKIVGGQGTKFKGNNADPLLYAHIDEGDTNPGYFTAKSN